MPKAFTTRLIESGPRGPLCEPLLRGLPDWFGIEESIVMYLRDVETMPCWVAEVERRPIGFLGLRSHNEHTAEIHVIAVDTVMHRRGVGRALVERAENYAIAKSHSLLMVKTLGPSREHEPYARTRSFYRSMGFLPLEEIKEIWGERNPCLIMVKPLRRDD